MSIEDIDYLKENSVKNNYIFFSDSKNRDKIAYPTPSEYTIFFVQPFRNVYSIDILDASIPRTEYFVESYSNSITFQIANNSYTTVYIDVGNHNSLSLSTLLSNSLKQTINNSDVYITCVDVSSPASIRGTFKFECPLQFSFDMSKSTISEIVGFDEISNPHNPDKYNWTTPILSNYQIFNSINGFKDSETYFIGPSTLLDDKLFPLYNTHLIAQKIYMDNVEGLLTEISITVGSFNNYNPSSNGSERYIQWYLYSHNITNDEPLHIITSGELYVSYTNGNLSNSPSLTTSDVVAGSIPFNIFTDIVNKNIKLSINTYYWFVFKYNTKTSTDYINGTYGIYYDSTINDGSYVTNNNMTKVSNNNGITWSMNTDINNNNNALNIIIGIYPINYILTSPGLYSLVGQRYILLRCIEIDDHLLRSLSVGVNSLGLAKFKMGVLGFSDDRFDFSNIPEREFHPIGKLSKLSLRFERPDGSLYDFKGVNHTITFVIRYYTPTQKIKFVKSILNENYNADYVQYMNDKYKDKTDLLGDENADTPDNDVIDYENEDDGRDDDELEIYNDKRNYDNFNNFNNREIRQHNPTPINSMNSMNNINTINNNNRMLLPPLCNNDNSDNDTSYSDTDNSDSNNSYNSDDSIDEKIRYYNKII